MVSGWLRECTGMVVVVVVMVVMTLGGGMVLMGMLSLVWRGTLQRRVTSMSGRKRKGRRKIKEGKGEEVTIVIAPEGTNQTHYDVTMMSFIQLSLPSSIAPSIPFYHFFLPSFPPYLSPSLPSHSLPPSLPPLLPPIHSLIQLATEEVGQLVGEMSMTG